MVLCFMINKKYILKPFFETPRKHDRTYTDIKFSMGLPTRGELKQRINMFLEGLTH